jgi:hypothetical protein
MTPRPPGTDSVQGEPVTIDGTVVQRRHAVRCTRFARRGCVAGGFGDAVASTPAVGSVARNTRGFGVCGECDRFCPALNIAFEDRCGV